MCIGKKNLDIALTTEGYKYVLNEKHIDLSVVNAPRANLERYEKLVKVDE